MEAFQHHKSYPQIQSQTQSTYHTRWETSHEKPPHDYAKSTLLKQYSYSYQDDYHAHVNNQLQPILHALNHQKQQNPTNPTTSYNSLNILYIIYKTISAFLTKLIRKMFGFWRAKNNIIQLILMFINHCTRVSYMC